MMAVEIEFEGKTQRLVDLARRFGLKRCTVLARFRNGDPVEALFVGIKGSNFRKCVICDLEFQTPPSNIKSTCGKSCSVLLRELKKPNARSRSRLYRIWCCMKSRCKGHGELAKKYYADRGISVCEKWASSFVAFEEWAKTNGYSDGMSIDRIDGSLGYNPDNCRWATAAQQSQNKAIRQVQKTSKYKGVSWSSERSKWVAQGNANKKFFHIGRFNSEEDAAKAYDTWAREHHGEFAYCNFTEGVQSF